ncbi:MAG: dockerin type I repeat-containing protein [Prevotella sp.]|nr:dockerin type I repeat-containing protein [Prevotella sp.]
MKITKLLVLGAVLLLGSNAAQAVDENVWTEPVPTEFASLVVGETYYFYNVGSGLFFTQGNAYGTQASVGKIGLQVRVEQQSDGSYTLTDYVKTQSAWKMWWFVADLNIMYVDYNGQADYLWEITDMGNKVYRLSPSANNPNWNDNRKFVGLDRTSDPENTALTSDCTEDGGAFIDWKLVPVEAGEAYEAQMNIYEAAMQLKDILNQAEEIGASVADQVAVYNNTGSSLDEINAAIQAAKDAIEARELELAQQNYPNSTVAKPTDVTKLFIRNPTFAGNDLTGWDGSGWGAYNGKENAERYSMNYDTYQDLEGLLEGVYMFNANSFYRAGNSGPAYNNYKADNEESKYAKLYAATTDVTAETSIASPFSASLTAKLSTGNWSSVTDNELQMTFWIPNDMVAADAFFKDGNCTNNEVYVAVTDGKLRVGARKDTTIEGDWSIFDDFSLTYYGKGSDAIKLLKDMYLDELAGLDFEDEFYSDTYDDAYNAALNSLKNATTLAGVTAAKNAIDTAIADLEKNIDLWKQLSDLRTEAFEAAANTDYMELYRNKCSKWANTDYTNLVNAQAATNEELEAEIEKVKALIEDVYHHPDGEDVDMTNLMVNPNFTQYGEGWTRVAANGGNVTAGGLASNPCYEAWNNANFDIYQNVQNAPRGVYRISVQGFYRYGRGGAFASYLNGEYYTTKETCPVFVYLNTNMTPFTNIFGDPVQIYDQAFYSGSNDYATETLSDGTTVYFPNGMSSASIAFGAGMYTQSAYGLVANDGDVMRIGVKGSTNQKGDSWAIWDNFKITYCGFKADVVKPVLQEAIAEAENSLNEAIGSNVVADLQAAINQGKAVVNGTNGQAMFEALIALYDLKEAVTTSKNIMAKLAAANEELAAAVPNAVATQDIIDEANALHSTISEGIANHSYADDDVDGLIEDINTMIHRLGIPQNMASATAANPVDCSTIIINPAYDNGNDNGWTGDAAVNGSSKNAEKFNTNFDYYQVLTGLPEGTYRVVLQGFYRAGGYVQDYNSYVENAQENNNAMLYATSGDKTTSVGLKRLASEAITTESLADGWAYCNEAGQLAVPNTMAAAGVAFDTNKGEGPEKLYAGNTVSAKVGADGKLIIGLKKEVQIENDWTIWDNWQLFYLGKSFGDVNNDGDLNISDVMATVSHILGDTPENFSKDAADVNGDGAINITDVMSMVDAILGGASN